MKTKRFPLILVLAVLALVELSGATAQVRQEWVVPPPAASAVNVDIHGNVYVSGTVNGECTTTKIDPSGRQIWTVNVTGDSSNQCFIAQNVAIDPQGNVYVAGFSGNEFGRIEYVTFKYDPSGHMLWSASFMSTFINDLPATGDFFGPSMAIDGLGNVYVVGSVRGTDDFADYATVKYDAGGTQLWFARYDRPGDSHDHPAAVTVDGAGNVYVTGRSGTLKYDTNGNLVWIAEMDAAEPVFGGLALAYDTLGNVFVTGPAYDGPDLVTAKYNPTGERCWLRRYRSYDYPWWPWRNAGLAVTPAGGVQVCGSFVSSGLATSDLVTLEYDVNGTQLWANAAPTGGAPLEINRYYISMATDTLGSAYVTGSLFDPQHGFDYLTVKYDTHGNQLWAARYVGGVGGESYNLAMQLAVDTSGNVYVTGDSGTVKYSQTNLDGIPVILTAPQPQYTEVTGMTNITFSVKAGGSEPLLYQWRLHSVPIPGETNCVLSLTNVVPAQSGDYSVEVSNAVGTTMSPLARLTVHALPTVFHSPSFLYGAGFQFTLDGQPGCCFQIDISTNLLDWFFLDNILNPTGSVQYLDASATNAPQRFYRAFSSQ